MSHHPPESSDAQGSASVKSQSLPDFVLPLRSYKELGSYVRAFADDHLDLLIICSYPGLGKSHRVRRVLGDKACWIDGNISAFGLYQRLYEFRDQPIVIDDVDELYRDRKAVLLLKALCQSERTRSLCWLTDAPALDHRNIPRQFVTESRVLVLANQWKSVNINVAALEDRGHFAHFCPTPAEIHRQASTWFGDKEIYEFIGAHLHLIERHSLRTYKLAEQEKSAGLDWKKWVLSRFLKGPALEVALLKSSLQYKSEKARERAFSGSRATYYRLAKQLRIGEGGQDSSSLLGTGATETATDS
jgi:hypothetical protein